MNKLLQVDFPHQGPFGNEMALQLKELANSINQEPGIIWKIWTENEQQQEAGGVYIFESKETALAYLEMHTARLNEMGIKNVRGRIFDMNQELSQINNGPMGE